MLSASYMFQSNKDRERAEVGGSGYLGGAHIHATVDAAKDIIVLLEAGSLGSRHAEAARVGGRHSEAGGLGGGGGGSGGQVGEGGALHLLHAIVPTVVVVNLHGRNPACLHLYIIRHELELKLAALSFLLGKIKQ